MAFSCLCILDRPWATSQCTARHNIDTTIVEHAFEMPQTGKLEYDIPCFFCTLRQRGSGPILHWRISDKDLRPHLVTFTIKELITTDTPYHIMSNFMVFQNSLLSRPFDLSKTSDVKRYKYWMSRRMKDTNTLHVNSIESIKIRPCPS